MSDDPRATMQTAFRAMLSTVIGQAMAAAGYRLEDSPLRQANGRFRFLQTLTAGGQAVVIFQLLAYVDTEWAPRTPSRFRVTLSRLSEQGEVTEQRDLSALVVADFGVAVLPSADHWWTFQTQQDLAQAIAEAGHLLVGYGLPWLHGQLKPPDAVE